MKPNLQWGIPDLLTANTPAFLSNINEAFFQSQFQKTKLEKLLQSVKSFLPKTSSYYLYLDWDFASSKLEYYRTSWTGNNLDLARLFAGNYFKTKDIDSFEGFPLESYNEIQLNINKIKLILDFFDSLP